MEKFIDIPDRWQANVKEIVPLTILDWAKLVAFITRQVKPKPKYYKIQLVWKCHAFNKEVHFEMIWEIACDHFII